MHITSTHRLGSDATVGECSNFKKKSYAHAKSIMVMRSNEREECCLCTLIERKRKRYDNTVDVVICLHDPTDPSTEHTAPPCSAHVQLDDVPRALDPVQGRGRVSSASRLDDGVDDVIRAGLRLSPTMILMEE